MMTFGRASTVLAACGIRVPSFMDGIIVRSLAAAVEKNEAVPSPETMQAANSWAAAFASMQSELRVESGRRAAVRAVIGMLVVACVGVCWAALRLSAPWRDIVMGGAGVIVALCVPTYGYVRLRVAAIRAERVVLAKIRALPEQSVNQVSEAPPLASEEGMDAHPGSEASG